MNPGLHLKRSPDFSLLFLVWYRWIAEAMTVLTCCDVSLCVALPPQLHTSKPQDLTHHWLHVSQPSVLGFLFFCSSILRKLPILYIGCECVHVTWRVNVEPHFKTSVNTLSNFICLLLLISVLQEVTFNFRGNPSVFALNWKLLKKNLRIVALLESLLF